MYRNAILTLIVFVGSAALSEAQFYHEPPPPPQQASLQGVWYYGGDPTQPCSIQAASGKFGVSRVIFTNERGEQSEGRVLPGGRVVAEDWNDLRGRVDRDGDAIIWANGTVWRR